MRLQKSETRGFVRYSAARSACCDFSFSAADCGHRVISRMIFYRNCEVSGGDDDGEVDGSFHALSRPGKVVTLMAYRR